MRVQLLTTGEKVSLVHGDVVTEAQIGRAWFRMIDSGAIAVLPPLERAAVGGAGDAGTDELSVARGEQPDEAGDVVVVGDVAPSQVDEQPDEETPETAAPDGAGAPFPRHVGAGVYELSNGERVKGKQAAFTAQAQLEE